MRENAINDKICENMRDFERYAESHVNSALGYISIVFGTILDILLLDTTSIKMAVDTTSIDNGYIGVLQTSKIVIVHYMSIQARHSVSKIVLSHFLFILLKDNEIANKLF